MQKDAEKKLKYKDFFCIQVRKTNLNNEIYDYICIHWSHRNSNESFKETFGSHSRQTFNDSLVQENYRREQACDKRKLIILIIIIIIVIAPGGNTFSKVVLNQAGRVVGSSSGLSRR
jgi:hypothetical protein